MNGYKITGYIIIFFAIYERATIIGDYPSGKLGFWPFGTEVGAVLIIALGVFMLKKSSRNNNRI